MPNAPPTLVYRQLAIPVPVFDYLKTYQRDHMARHGEHLTLVQTVAAIVRDHQRNEEREAHERNKHPALLRTS